MHYSVMFRVHVLVHSNRLRVHRLLWGWRGSEADFAASGHVALVLIVV